MMNLDLAMMKISLSLIKTTLLDVFQTVTNNCVIDFFPEMVWTEEGRKRIVTITEKPDNIYMKNPINIAYRSGGYIIIQY